LEDVEVFGEDAGLVGGEGSIIFDADSMQKSCSDSSRRCLMRARRFRVVLEVHSEVEVPSAAEVSRLLSLVKRLAGGLWKKFLTSKSLSSW